MLRFTRGDIFRQRVEALVNPVNCLGVMGRGLALQFKVAYPECFPPYRQACRDGALRPGNVLITPTGYAMPKCIVHFPTKRDWRDNSLRHDIDEGLRDLAIAIQHRRMTSIAVPPLGCGLGGLSWTSIRPLVERHLGGLSCDITVLEPVPSRQR